MSGFWNRGSGTDGHDPVSQIDADSIEAYLESGTTVQTLIPADQDGLHRQKDDWESVETPSDDANSFAVLTDRAISFVVGRCQDPSIDGDYVRTIPYEEVESVGVEDSLLSTTFVVETTEGVRLSFTPDGSADLTQAARFIRRAKSRWRSAMPAFEGLDEQLAALESALVEGEYDEAERVRRRVNDAIHEARSNSSLNEVDLDALNGKLEVAKTRIQRTRARGRYERAMELVADAEQFRDADDIDSCLDLLEDACEQLETAAEVSLPPDLDFDSIGIESRDGERTMYDLLGDCCAAATTEDGTERAVDRWQRLYRCYSFLDSAVSRTPTVLVHDAETIEFQFVWVAHRCVRTLRERAAALEAEADELLEDSDSAAAREAYQEARSLLEECRAVDSPRTATPSVTAEIEALEEKLELTEWEWGGA